MHGIDGSYDWLYPKTGGFAVHRRIFDYEAEKKAGFSIYPDGRDLEPIILPEPYKAPDNEIKPETNTKGEVKTYNCKCGKVFNHHLPFSAHKRICK